MLKYAEINQNTQHTDISPVFMQLNSSIAFKANIIKHREKETGQCGHSGKKMYYLCLHCTMYDVVKSENFGTVTIHPGRKHRFYIQDMSMVLKGNLKLHTRKGSFL